MKFNQIYDKKCASNKTAFHGILWVRFIIYNIFTLIIRKILIAIFPDNKISNSFHFLFITPIKLHYKPAQEFSTYFQHCQKLVE